MKNPFKPASTNCTWVTNKLLSHLNICVNAETVRKKIEEHPYYPGLLAITDCLDELNIENQAIQVNVKSFASDDLSFPFIAHLPINDGTFIVIHNIENGKVKISNELQKNLIIDQEPFLRSWKGVALKIEKNQDAFEENYWGNRIKYNLGNGIIPGITILFLFLICKTFIIQNLGTIHLLFLCSKFLGLSISTLLLIQSINSNNPIVQALCNLGGKNGCKDILKSDAAKITSWLSWSEVGFIYFAGSLILLLSNAQNLWLVMALAVVSFPYTIYSISHQFRNKTWCILCCGVQVILFSDFLISVLSLKLNPFVEMHVYASIFRLFISFSIPILLWAFIKPFFVSSTQVNPLRHQLNDFKFNTDLFEYTLNRQPRYALNSELTPLNMGCEDASNVITMISNPFCEPCAKAHAFLHEWIETRDDVQIKIVFATGGEVENNRSNVAKHLNALNLLSDKKIAIKALDAWYKQNVKEFESWAAKYPVLLNEEVTRIVKTQNEWCQMIDVAETPTFLINGYKLPKTYRVEDMKYLLI